MRYKKGFTLAETLIVLGIIGVVAALTVPAVINSSSAKKAGAALAKFDNMFSNAIESKMTEDSISQITNGEENVSSFIKSLGRYIDWAPYDGNWPVSDAINSSTTNYSATSQNDDADTICNRITACILNDHCPDEYDLNGDGIVNITDVVTCVDRLAAAANTKLGFLYKLKDGTIVGINVKGSCFRAVSYGNLKGVVAEILVDIDGNKKRNNMGKDVFGFLLDGSGTLIPAGSIAHSNVDIRVTGRCKAIIGSYTNVCSTVTDETDQNLACTGKIAENGWSLNGLDME